MRSAMPEIGGSMRSDIINADPETIEAARHLIEKGGLDRELMLELRRLFLDNTEREGNTPAPRNLTERV